MAKRSKVPAVCIISADGLMLFVRCAAGWHELQCSTMFRECPITHLPLHEDGSPVFSTDASGSCGYSFVPDAEVGTAIRQHLSGLGVSSI